MKVQKTTSKHSSIRLWFKKLKPKKGSGREFLGKLSNGLMVPIAVLPIAGLLLGIGSAILNAVPNSLESRGDLTVEGWYTLYGFAQFITNAGNFVFSNLAALFAIAIAIAFTRDAGVAGFAAFVAWLCFNGMQNAMIFPASYTYAPLGDTDSSIPAGVTPYSKTVASYNILFWKDLDTSIFTANLGINSLQTSVFGGLIVGSLVAWIYNRTYQIQMPKILGFFSGTRFVPIASLLAMMPLAVIFGIIWPGIGLLLSIIGKGLGTLSANGGANALIFGYIERALVPFGLHHAFYSPLWYTSVGGDMTNAGIIVPFIRVNDQVYAVTGVINGGVTTPLIAAGETGAASTVSWAQVIQKLNPGYDFSADTGSWAGDQRLWFAINRYLAGKEVLLSNGEHYRITYQTFAQNTLNSALPAVTMSNAADAISEWNKLVGQTASNGTVTVAGTVSTPYSSSFTAAFPGVNPGQYEQGKYPFMVFGLPAAAAAMVMAAPKENRKQAGSIVISAGLTSFLTGITEPMEFSFLFLAPWLYYGVHAVLCAISFWLMSLLGANVGQTFSGGLIDLSIYGFLPDGLGYSVNSYWAVVIGIVYIPIYYTLFYFLIKRFNLATPGRGGTLKTKKDYLAMKDAKKAGKFTPTQITAYHLINAFGGAQNIAAVNACITKLRVSVKDPKAVNEQEIKDLGAQGIMKPSPTLLHAIFGTLSDPIKTQMNNIITNNIDVKALEKVVKDYDETDQLSSSQPEQKQLDTTSTDKALAKEIIVLAPVSGKVKPLAEVNDKTFSDKIMGDGAAIIPDDNKFFAPGKLDSKVDVCFPTGHAYIIDVNGAKIMIHIGLETVSLNSGVSDPSKLIAFKPHVKTGDNLTEGQALVDVDFNVIKDKNLDTITPVIALTETLNKYEVSVIPALNSEIKACEPLLKLTLKTK